MHQRAQKNINGISNKIHISPAHVIFLIVRPWTVCKIANYFLQDYMMY